MHTCATFTGANFLARLSVADVSELIDRLCRQAAELPRVKEAGLDFDAIRRAILKREAESSTAIGFGVMLPHAKVPGLRELAPVIATLARPLDAATPDGRPLEIAGFLLIPDDKPMEGLKFIARFARYVIMPELREELLASPTTEALEERLSRLHIDSGKALAAGDIMGKCSFALTPEMPLKEATVLMAKERVSVAPVLDGKRLVGQVICSKLFTLGLPDFFSQLKSVGFIRFFDPFEGYFRIEADSLVGQVMSDDCCTFRQDATLIEIVFEISIRKHPQVYVVDDQNQLLGIIDQSLLLQRIINL